MTYNLLGIKLGTHLGGTLNADSRLDQDPILKSY